MSAGYAAENPYADFGQVVSAARPDERVAFVRRTYMHLAMAVYAFAALEWAYFQTGFAEWLFNLVGRSQIGMLVMFGAFIGVSWMAERWAQVGASPAKQYAGLFTYVVAQSIFFVPLLVLANNQSLSLGGNEYDVVTAAGITTLVMFGALSAAVWFTGTDFSFMRTGLMIGGFAIFGLIIASMVLGLSLGVWFSVGMIVFASAYILYDTSNVMHHYRTDQHVAASLALFASVALLFWYVLRLFMALASRE